MPDFLRLDPNAGATDRWLLRKAKVNLLILFVFQCLTPFYEV